VEELRQHGVDIPDTAQAERDNAAFGELVRTLAELENDARHRVCLRVLLRTAVLQQTEEQIAMACNITPRGVRKSRRWLSEHYPWFAALMAHKRQN
jgi:hypothetical protein